MVIVGGSRVAIDHWSSTESRQMDYSMFLDHHLQPEHVYLPIKEAIPCLAARAASQDSCHLAT